MKKILPIILILCTSCIGPVSPKQVTDLVLSVSQVLCVLASGLTDASEVATVCKIRADLVPAINDVLGQAKVEGVGKLPARLDAGK